MGFILVHDGNANLYKIINLADPTDLKDAVNKDYVDGLVLGLLELKGEIDASTNPNYPAALKGDAYLISVAGKVGGGSGRSVDAGDLLVAKEDNAGGTEASVGADWFVVEHNLLQATETVSGVAKIATTGDIDAETDDTKMVTPAKLAHYGPPFVDDKPIVHGGTGDPTKKLRLEVDALTTATTRVWTAPDNDIDMADVAHANRASLDLVSGTNTGDEPDSSTTVKGIIELATQTEVNTGTDESRAVTPKTMTTAPIVAHSNRASLDLVSGTNTGDEPDASATVKGIIELATLTEVNTGTDTVRAVTPKTLADSDLSGDSHTHANKALLDTYTQTEADLADAVTKKHAHANSAALDLVSGTNTGDEASASATVEGVIELATQAEVDTGTDTVRAVTPATLSSWSGIPVPLTKVVVAPAVSGDGATTIFPIVHGLMGPTIVQLWKVAPPGPFPQATAPILLAAPPENDPATGTATFTFAVAPPVGDIYDLIIIG